MYNDLKYIDFNSKFKQRSSTKLVQKSSMFIAITRYIILVVSAMHYRIKIDFKKYRIYIDFIKYYEMRNIGV